MSDPSDNHEEKDVLGRPYTGGDSCHKCDYNFPCWGDRSLCQRGFGVQKVSDASKTTRDVASSFHLGTRILPCAKCGGEGRIWKSRYGGNDPDVWDAGQCPTCEGSGNQTCEDCGNHPAVAEWKVQGKPYLICRSCHDEWLEDESDV